MTRGELRRMRRSRIHLPIALACLAVGACAHEERRLAGTIVESDARQATTTGRVAQYLVADPNVHGNVVVLALGAGGAHGIVVEKRRVVFGAGEPRVAEDAPAEAIAGARKIPSRFGGGFLFWTANDVYRASAFDAALVPVAHIPEPVESISFAARSVLVRGHNGERWGLELPKGERTAVAPLGVADVHALDDGRALAVTDSGVVLTSIDAGQHWTDATAQLKTAPEKLIGTDDELWVVDTNGGASRLEADGHLSWFDKAPEYAVTDIRPKDPRWRERETPLWTAFHSGAAIEGGHEALVMSGGDLARVDVRTGQLVSVVPGGLPPDAHCDAFPTTGDVLFACTSRTGSGSSFVVSHTLGPEPPIVEQTFGSGFWFYGSDDGGLAYGQSCSGSGAGQHAVCVRQPNGRWEDRDLSGMATDGGIPDVVVARWIPRSDGRAVAVIEGPVVGIYDPSTMMFLPGSDELRGLADEGGALFASAKMGHKGGRRGLVSNRDIVDTTWSFGPTGTLRGWLRRGSSFEVTEDGRVVHSPYELEIVSAGAFGLGRSKDGRLYQSTDHGGSWTEVATPPSGIETNDLVRCSSAGCDLGAFYRSGWSLQPPSVEPARRVAKPAPEVRRVRGTELTCRPSGAVVSKILPRTDDSPDDLGLGVARLPVVTSKSAWTFVRNLALRTIISPVHGPSRGDGSDIVPSARALFSGYGTERDGDMITVTGPNKSALQLRRTVAYAAPFDPQGRIVRTAIPLGDVVAAARRVGMGTDEILSEDPTENGNVLAVTPLDPNAVSDVVIHNVERSVLSIFRSERIRVAVRTSTGNASVVSAVALSGDETALLDVDSSGTGHVFKVLASGVIADLFDVTTGSEAFYPANPDALAVGPKGDLAILRTPSGSDPPSALDPALLVVQGQPPVALAPWSELKLADDPACKAEPGGYRAVVQTTGPWIRVTTPNLRVVDNPAIARVRWTTKRVCLEGFEVQLPPVAIRRIPMQAASESFDFASWLIGKGSTFARVVVAEGVEWRQPLECSIVSTGP